MSFATRLAQARKEAGKTQRAVAEALSVSVQAVSQWENGIVEISSERIEGLADFLHVDQNWLRSGVATAESSTLRSERQSSIDRSSLRNDVISINVYLLEDVAKIVSAVEAKNEDLYGSLVQDTIFTRAGPNDRYFGVLIKGDQLAPDLKSGDVEIFSTRLRAEVGDCVVALQSYTSVFQFMNLLSDPESTVAAIYIMSSVWATVPERAIVSKDAGDEDHETEPAIMILGPMVEKRSYRIKR